MAKKPGLLRLLVLFAIATSSGCASWHYRKDDKGQKTAVGSTSTSGNREPGPILQGLSNASLHGWNFNSRW